MYLLLDHPKNHWINMRSEDHSQPHEPLNFLRQDEYTEHSFAIFRATQTINSLTLINLVIKYSTTTSTIKSQIAS